MKKMIAPCIVLICALILTGCVLEQDFDSALLIGKWRSNTEFYRYDVGGTGVTWDTSDDVTEAEGQPFTWTLVVSELKHIHMMAMGGSIPKIYQVIELTPTVLTYRDDFRTYSFVKVSD